MKIIRLLILLLLFNITANAQRVYVIYTNGIPTTCIRGMVYVNVNTGLVYTYKVGVGCTTAGVGINPSSSFIPYNNGGVFSDSLFSQSGGNITLASGQLLIPRGTALAPTFAFDSSTGIYSTSANRIAMSINNSLQFLLYNTQIDLPASTFIGMSENLALVNDGANILSQRNATNAQRFNLANTFTSSANREDLSFYFSSNVAHIATTTTGATARTLQLDYGGTATAGITIPITSGPINFGGVVNATTGFQIGGAATNANVLRGNGTNFISQALIPTDVGISFAQVTGSNFTTTSLTLVDITGLSIPLTTNATYYLTCNINGNGADASGVAFGVNYSAAGAAVELGILADVAGTGVRSRRINTLASATAQSFWTSATDVSTSIKGRVTTGANAGNLTIQIQKGTSGTATVYIGSMCMAVRVS